VVAAGAGVLMAKRSFIGMLELRLAFERSGRTVPIAAQESPPPPPDPPADEPLEIPTEADLGEPVRGSLAWVVRPHAVPAGRPDWDYDPWRRGLK
jgi:hypothetical protein